MLSIRGNQLLVGWAYAEIGYSLAEHTRKSVTRLLSIRGNCLLVGWAYAEINFVHTQLSRSLIRVFIRTVPCFLPIPLSPFSRPLPNVLCSLFHDSVPYLTSSVPCLSSSVPCLLSSVPCRTWSAPFHPSSVTCLSSMFIVTHTLFPVSLLCSLFHILCSLPHNFSVPCLLSYVICLKWSVHCLTSSFPNLGSLFLCLPFSVSDLMSLILISLPPFSGYSELEFLKSRWGLGTEEE